MSKKIIIGIVVIIILLVLGVLGYMAWEKTLLENQDRQDINSQNSNAGQNNDSAVPQVELKAEVEGTGPAGGSLTICSDQCGNGVCQKEDLKCKDGNLNCICAETKADCPSDCR